jgi:hypothetical protein
MRKAQSGSGGAKISPRGREGRRRQGRSRASSLVTTLLVLVLLVTIVVAFLQSMSLERAASRSYGNLQRAQLAVDAGVEMASALLLGSLKSEDAGGVAYTTWAYYPEAGTNVFYSAITRGRPAKLGADDFLNASNTTWLFSPARERAANADPADPDAIASLPEESLENLNKHGRISAEGQDFRVPWCEISRVTNNGVVHISRVAFWIDDESSRFDVSTPRAHLPEDFAARRKSGVLEGETGFDALAAFARLQGISTNASALLSPNGPVQLLQGNETNSWEDLKYLVTTRSRSLNRIQYGPQSGDHDFRRGMKRRNLNWTNHTDPSIAISDRVEMLADAIEFGAPGYLTNIAYLEPAMTAAAYVPEVRREMRQTIAASLIDYLDEDAVPSQPALLNPADTNSPAAPVRKPENRGMPQVMARPAFFGAESAPVINEVQHIWNAGPGETQARADMDVVPDPSDGRQVYTIPVLWRFELWNMTDRALPAQPYSLRWYGFPQIPASAFGFGEQPVPEGEMVFDLGSLSFAPGEIKVVEVARTYVRRATSPPLETPLTYNRFRRGPDTSSISDDYPIQIDTSSAVLFRTDTGAWCSATTYLDGLAATGMTTGRLTHPSGSGRNKINDPRMVPLRAYLMEGTGASTPADLTRIDVWTRPRDGMRWGHGNLGKINNQGGNDDVQVLGYWFDRPRIAAGQEAGALSSAPVASIRNGPAESVGELGNIFDPSWTHPDRSATGPYYGMVEPEASSPAVSPFRGGASLRVGQPDGNTDYGANGWTLTDIFGTYAANFADGAPQMSGERDVPGTIRGRENINFPKEVVSASGTVRNLNLVFPLPSLSITTGAGTSFDPNVIFSDMKARLTRDEGGAVSGWRKARPFFSRGEISELASWSRPELYGPEETLAPESYGLPGLLNRSDSAREEILRRSIEQLTTGGLAFRVFVTGQYVTAPASDPAKTTIRASASAQATLLIEPAFNEATGELQDARVQVLDFTQDD